MLIGDVGPPRDVAAAQHAVLADMLLGERAVRGVGEEPVEKLTQVRVDGVPIEPDRVVELGIVREHARHVSDRPATVPRVRVGRRFAVVAVLAVAIISASAGSGGASVGVAKEPRSTRDEMVTQANAVCAQGLQEADALRTTSDPTARGATAAAEVDATLAALNRQIAGLGQLRGPASTDATLRTVVRQLRGAAAGLRQLQRVIVRKDSTINDAVRVSGTLVRRINRSTAKANDALRKLGFLGCIGVPAE